MTHPRRRRGDPDQVIALRRGISQRTGSDRIRWDAASTFPGLGSGQVDSHHATPAISRTMGQLWKEDLLPYRQLAKQLPMVMVSHAGLSRSRARAPRLHLQLLDHRCPAAKRSAISGLILSDDMEMGGILNHSSIEDAAVAAILAGTDMIEICRSDELIFRAYEALLTEAERSTAFRNRLAASALRVARAKRTMPVTALRPPTEKSIESLRQQVQSLAARVERTAERDPA